LRVGVLQVDLFIPGCSSLKEKRHVVKRLIERLKSRFNAGVAEVGCQDLWQRASIGVTCVGEEEREVARVIDLMEQFIFQQDGYEVARCDKEIR
jgi:uncharacterized protein